MTCTDVQLCLVDETLARSPDFETHLSGCVECQGFRSAQSSALRLMGTELEVPRRSGLALVQRRVAMVGAFALAVVGAWGLFFMEHTALSPFTTTNSPEFRPEMAVLPVARPELDEGSFEALLALSTTTARANPMVSDASYRSFGPLSSWLAPKTTQPLHSLGRVVSPLVLLEGSSP